MLSGAAPPKQEEEEEESDDTEESEGEREGVENRSLPVEQVRYSSLLLVSLQLFYSMLFDFVMFDKF